VQFIFQELQELVNHLLLSFVPHWEPIRWVDDIDLTLKVSTHKLFFKGTVFTHASLTVPYRRRLANGKKLLDIRRVAGENSQSVEGSVGLAKKGACGPDVIPTVRQA
jgi:hypothetical protein